MAKSKSGLTSAKIANCILYVAIGLLLIILKGGALDILMTIVGALFVVAGIVDIINGKDVTKGIIEVVIGIVIIVLGWTITDLVLLIFGILLVIKSIIELSKSGKKNSANTLSSIITLVIGILLIISRWALLDLICVIAGAVFILNGLLTLMGKNVKK